MWIKRFYERTLVRAVRERPVVLLTGARQTGKTSLLRHAFPELPFVSLDLPSEAETAERNPALFFERHGSPLVVDEVQHAPALLRHLKIAVDAKRRRRGQYILTGSQKLTLMKGVSESLAGRAGILELEPLALAEIRPSYPRVPVEHVLLRGGFPELWDDPEIDAFAFYRSYVATYLERDLRSFLNVANLRDFERFLRVCALRTAQILNKAEMARDVGISASTANAWLSALEASNIVHLIEPWFVNRSKSIAKSPKLFLADTGLLLYLLNIRTPDDLFSSPNLGAIWETFVFSEMRKLEERETGSWSIHFWRDRGKEIDFLVHRGGRYDLYEAKWTETPRGRDLSGFADAEAAMGKARVISKTLVCRAPEPFPLGEGVRAVPVDRLEM
jgi:predicted AAA+ superfamily ATPase